MNQFFNIYIADSRVLTINLGPLKDKEVVLDLVSLDNLDKHSHVGFSVLDQAYHDTNIHVPEGKKLRVTVEVLD